MGEIYERRIVAFIDILGWSEACAVESPRLVNASKVIHDVALNYSKTIKERISVVSEVLPARYMEIHVGAMSDSLSSPRLRARAIRCSDQPPAPVPGFGSMVFLRAAVSRLATCTIVRTSCALVEAVQLEREARFVSPASQPASLSVAKVSIFWFQHRLWC